MAPLSRFFLQCSVMSLLLLLLPSMAAAQTSRNITKGSSLRPQGRPSSWISSSGDFAAGFRPLDSNDSLYLFAVWFTRAPNQTVVWAANRNKPVEAGSMLRLGTDGRLILTVPGGAEVWSSSIKATNVTHAAMLDSGNLVLASGMSGGYAWESFHEPTDTMLPSQELSPGMQLTSHVKETDYSEGRFQLQLNNIGNLTFWQLPRSCPRDADCNTQKEAYWSSDAGFQLLVYSKDGDVFLSRSKRNSINLTSGKSGYPPREFYQRATLDRDGILRQYVYPKNRTGASWTVVDSFPKDICTGVGGICGYNSYCIPGQSTLQKANCICPTQYSLVDTAREYEGCKPDFSPQSCEANGGGEFQLVKISGVDFPGGDFEYLNPVNEERCRNACLNNCYCAVAIYRGDDCWIKKLPLSKGKYDGGDTATALLKVARNTTVTGVPDPPLVTTGGRRERNGLFLLGLGNCLLLAAVFLLVFIFYHKKLQSIGSPPVSRKLGRTLRPFTYKELEEATEHFKEEIGKGAFGVVYKGLLVSDSAEIPIAVKRLKVLDDEVEKEFENEVKVIAQIHHKNLVRLLGYCNEGPRRLLVYEYMSNGSLLDVLLGSSKPEWATRVQLALGVARGLLYLHEGCSTQIIHCDIKPQNILIDDNLTARITDFGLSKLLLSDQSRTLTGIRGTRGYVAPEWFKNLPVTSKVDVYSFGVQLLEIICCRRNVEAEAGDSKIVLAYWAYDCFRAGRLDVLVGDEAGPLADTRRLERLVRVALWCIQEEPLLRPTMKKVTQMLEGAIEVPVPPDPSVHSSSFSTKLQITPSYT